MDASPLRVKFNLSWIIGRSHEALMSAGHGKRSRLPTNDSACPRWQREPPLRSLCALEWACRAIARYRRVGPFLSPFLSLREAGAAECMETRSAAPSAAPLPRQPPRHRDGAALLRCK